MAPLQCYPAYKDSGVKWIGEIPEGWMLRKIKFISKIFNGDSLNENQKKKFESDDSEDLAYISSKDVDINNSSIQYQNGLRIPIFKNKLKVAPEDSTLLCIEGGSAGRKIAFTNQKVCFVNKLACFQINRDNKPKYLFYSIKALLFQTQFKLAMSGMIGGVAISAINNFTIVVPHLPEQTAIAHFLDEKCSKIDMAVDQKEKLVKLLKERKQIMIQNAVTKGLNPNAKMKDSMVDWIGQIPEGWEVKRFLYLFTQSRLPTRPDLGVVTAYRDGQVTLRSNRRLNGYTEAILEHGYQGVCNGQLVLNSMDAFEGAIGVSDSDGRCTPEYVVCDPKLQEILPEYFAFLLREMALAKYIQVICNAVRQRAVRIRFNNLIHRFLIVPPIDEQIAIVAHIEKETTKIAKAITLQQKQIEKLKEYKATLINSAVTGKIKVVQ